MTSLSEKDRTYYEAMASHAEQLGEACRVVLARAQWNVDHPDSTLLEMAGWSDRATTVARVLARTILHEPLSDMDASTLENLLILDSITQPAKR